MSAGFAGRRLLLGAGDADALGADADDNAGSGAGAASETAAALRFLRFLLSGAAAAADTWLGSAAASGSWVSLGAVFLAFFFLFRTWLCILSFRFLLFICVLVLITITFQLCFCFCKLWFCHILVLLHRFLFLGSL